MRGENLGVKRRRRWSDEEKHALRHEITRQQVYALRHEMKRKGFWHPEGGVVFLPVGAVPDPVKRSVQEPDNTTIEVGLCNGRSLRVPSGIGATDLARLIRVVERA